MSSNIKQILLNSPGKSTKWPGHDDLWTVVSSLMTTQLQLFTRDNFNKVFLNTDLYWQQNKDLKQTKTSKQQTIVLYSSPSSLTFLFNTRNLDINTLHRTSFFKGTVNQSHRSFILFWLSSFLWLFILFLLHVNLIYRFGRNCLPFEKV